MNERGKPWLETDSSSKGQGRFSSLSLVQDLLPIVSIKLEASVENMHPPQRPITRQPAIDPDEAIRRTDDDAAASRLSVLSPSLFRLSSS